MIFWYAVIFLERKPLTEPFERIQTSQDENSVLQLLCGEKPHHGFVKSKIYT